MNQQEKNATMQLLEQFQQSAIDVVQPVMEQAIIFAAEYAKACGRDIILSKDHGIRNEVLCNERSW